MWTKTPILNNASVVITHGGFALAWSSDDNVWLDNFASESTVNPLSWIVLSLVAIKVVIGAVLVVYFKKYKAEKSYFSDLNLTSQT